MQATVSVIGIDNAELRWVKTLVTLLRHPDPSVPELARQALVYLTDAAQEAAVQRLHLRPGELESQRNLK